MSRLSIELAKSGMDAVFVYKTGTTCPCTVDRDEYSPQWHIDNPTAEDCEGRKIINVTTTSKNVKVFCNDIMALTNSRALGSKELTEIGIMQNVDLALIGTAETNGDYFNAGNYDEHDSYWLINNVRYVTRRHYDQFTNRFQGDMFLVSRQQ